MGFFNIFKRPIDAYKNYKYVKMLSGQSPIFSQFGDDIYESDIVKNCIRIIATEIAKLQPKHIRTLNDGRQETINSSINKLLKFGPNPLMTTSDFLEKCTWLWATTYNCFIYPKYYINEQGKKIYTGFYPLKPITVDFLEDLSSSLYIKFTFANGTDYTLPYQDIIHWRKDFSFNDLMGGDASGRPNNKEMLKVLNINNTVIEGLDKTVRASLTINGILKINTLLDDEKQEVKRKDFEKQLLNSQSGIMATDLQSEYVPLNRNNPVVIDPNTLKFIESKILYNYGISSAIFTGDFSDEQYQAFYEKTLENLIISLGQVFTKTLFTQREMEMGNEVIFYTQSLMFTNIKNKIAVADILGNRGAITNNELLSLFGYPPYEGGDVRKTSLNFINCEIADSYQLQSLKVKGKEVNKDE